MGILMGRAFREGVEKHRKISMRVKPRQWKPLDDLKGLTSRTQQTKLTMGPLQEVPAMVRIEEEHWILRESHKKYSRNSHTDWLFTNQAVQRPLEVRLICRQPLKSLEEWLRKMVKWL